MYISGGENVYPAEIENVLYELDQILEVAVIGVPDPKWGEAGCAVTVLKDGASLSLPQLHAACTGQLARYKTPAHLVLLPELPRNGSVPGFSNRLGQVLISQRFILRAGLWGSLRGRRLGRRTFAFRVGQIEVVCAVFAAARGAISPSPRVPAGRIRSR
ncbi:AMP-binding enzyme [Defluviimonas salinarum]|uniref:AMP-binding enzyme C-terminal domain-containing protein n=1 Tax=Defluviimonas salinarum TaxID=2992147 RepID=A0ABT3J886_9RHOB|nr:hypothetical protein [Defluviimonas salinarum]MCW3783640.1 hypothetical protein [Defluviimonas salinarum]